MANDVRNDNFIFPSRHVPNCFINSQVMNKLDTISNTIGNIDNIIGLSYEKNGNSIKEYKQRFKIFFIILNLRFIIDYYFLLSFDRSD